MHTMDGDQPGGWGMNDAELALNWSRGIHSSVANRSMISSFMTSKMHGDNDNGDESDDDGDDHDGE